MIVFYQEANGDYLAVDTDTNRYYLDLFGRNQFEGRATAIAGLVGSVCTTGISREFLLTNCKRVPKASVPAEWRRAIGQVEVKGTTGGEGANNSRKRGPNMGRFQVVEYTSFFAVRDTVTGQERPMGDGVDTLFDGDGNPILPGTPGFCDVWTEALNGDEAETLAAYFPDTFNLEGGS